MQTENNRVKANELLINWSKWLISINFLAATGCIIALKTAETTSKTGVFFFFAIIFFSFSVLCSTLFVFLLASQGLEANDTDTPQLLWLAKLQWILFTCGLFFVLLWIGILSKVF